LIKFIEADDGDTLYRTLKKNKYKDVNKVDDSGKTLLHHAMIAAAVECTKILLEHGADANIQDMNGWTALHFAAKSSIDNRINLKSLLKRTELKVGIPNDDKNLPLHYLARSKFYDQRILTTFITRGSDVNFQNLNGETPLHNTCFEPGHESAAQILIKNGANVDLVTVRGETALHWAARAGLLTMSQILIESGADITVTTGKNGTVLDVVAPVPELKQYLQENYDKLTKKSNRVLKRRPTETADQMQRVLTTKKSFYVVPRDAKSALFQNSQTVVAAKIHAPELTDSALSIALNCNWQVKHAVSVIISKFEGQQNLEKYNLYSSVQLMDPSALVADYPELLQNPDLYFQSPEKDPPPGVSKNPERKLSSPVPITITAQLTTTIPVQSAEKQEKQEKRRSFSFLTGKEKKTTKRDLLIKEEVTAKK